jgi:exosortase/archaeosortase family protein
LRSLTAIFALAIIYGFIEFRKNWQRVVVMSAAFPLAVFGNVVRLSLIIIAAEAFGQSAGDYVHRSSFFSLVPYVPAILGLMVLGRWLGKREATPMTLLETKPV